MAQSTGGFFSSTFGQVLSGIGAALGLGPLFDTGLNREMTANENDLSRLHDEYMSRLQQNNALQQMRIAQGYNVSNMEKQQQFEKDMSSTAYQRAVADMQAAGLNPASLGGSVQASSTPSTSLPGSSSAGASAGHSSALGFSGSTNTGLMESMFNAMVTNSREARKVASQEMLDNARHAHKMEEINEMKDAFSSKASKERSMADYMAEWEANKKRFAK